MTEEVPKNHSFLKFIVIFMGILIALGLIIVVWKVIDLAQKRAARQEQQATVETVRNKSFDFEVMLNPGERILETSAAGQDLWIRTGRDGKTSRLILVDRAGKIIGTIRVKQNNDNAAPAS